MPVHFVEGDHITVLDNVETASVMNNVLECCDKKLFGNNIAADTRLGTKAQ